MYDPVKNIWQFNSITLWIDFGVSMLLILFSLLVVGKAMHRKSFTIGAIFLSVLSIASWFFNMTLILRVCMMLFTAYFVVTIIQNQNEVRDFVGSFFKRKRVKNAQKVYDRHAVCQKIALAVETLSKSKTGALITFEKNNPLSDVVKSGTMLHSPITPELLVTIFYPGTRLHDGAVVIRRDEILAASVYYTPTTKPLTGKFGSRHRAAIGISEITDSVTVIVSEETGRVSLAYRGELIPVAPDSFLRTIEEYLFAEEKTESESK